MLKIIVFVSVYLIGGIANAGNFPLLQNGRSTCESLWVERNQIENLAGYCFVSELGSAVFDNTDCTTSAPVLNPRTVTKIEQIQNQESRLACNVNTARSHINVFGKNGVIRFGRGGVTLGMWPRALRQIDAFPNPSNNASTCTVSGLDAQGDGFLAVRSGPDVRYRQIGQMVNGDRVISAQRCEGRWCFASETRRGPVPIGVTGWYHSNYCQ